MYTTILILASITGQSDSEWLVCPVDQASPSVWMGVDLEQSLQPVTNDELLDRMEQRLGLTPDPSSLVAARNRRIAQGKAKLKSPGPAKTEPSKWTANSEIVRNRWGWRTRRNYWTDQYGSKTYRNPSGASCRGSTWGWIRRRR